MHLSSLDPRINRWQLPANWPNPPAKNSLDQLVTFEVFAQKRENTPFAYVGPVHAPDVEMAFLFAKEQYSRRASCCGLWVVKTQHVWLTPYVNDDESVWETLDLPAPEPAPTENQPFEIFTLKKRGKAHTHAGTVMASGYEAALAQANTLWGNQVPCVNVWIVPAAALYKSLPEDTDMWSTLADKKYREPVAYKVLDKINAFKTQTAENK